MPAPEVILPQIEALPTAQEQQEKIRRLTLQELRTLSAEIAARMDVPETFRTTEALEELRQRIDAMQQAEQDPAQAAEHAEIAQTRQDLEELRQRIERTIAAQPQPASAPAHGRGLLDDAKDALKSGVTYSNGMAENISDTVFGTARTERWTVNQKRAAGYALTAGGVLVAGMMIKGVIGLFRRGRTSAEAGRQASEEVEKKKGGTLKKILIGLGVGTAVFFGLDYLLKGALREKLREWKDKAKEFLPNNEEEPPEEDEPEEESDEIAEIAHRAFTPLLLRYEGDTAEKLDIAIFEKETQGFLVEILADFEEKKITVGALKDRDVQDTVNDLYGELASDAEEQDRENHQKRTKLVQFLKEVMGQHEPKLRKLHENLRENEEWKTILPKKFEDCTIAQMYQLIGGTEMEALRNFAVQAPKILRNIFNPGMAKEVLDESFEKLQQFGMREFALLLEAADAADRPHIRAKMLSTAMLGHNRLVREMDTYLPTLEVNDREKNLIKTIIAEVESYDPSQAGSLLNEACNEDERIINALGDVLKNIRMRDAVQLFYLHKKENIPALKLKVLHLLSRYAENQPDFYYALRSLSFEAVSSVASDAVSSWEDLPPETQRYYGMIKRELWQKIKGLDSAVRGTTGLGVPEWGGIGALTWWFTRWGKIDKIAEGRVPWATPKMIEIAKKAREARVSRATRSTLPVIGDLWLWGRNMLSGLWANARLAPEIWKTGRGVPPRIVGATVETVKFSGKTVRMLVTSRYTKEALRRTGMTAVELSKALTKLKISPTLAQAFARSRGAMGILVESAKAGKVAEAIRLGGKALPVLSKFAGPAAFAGLDIVMAYVELEENKARIAKENNIAIKDLYKLRDTATYAKAAGGLLITGTWLAKNAGLLRLAPGALGSAAGLSLVGFPAIVAGEYMRENAEKVAETWLKNAQNLIEEQPGTLLEEIDQMAPGEHSYWQGYAGGTKAEKITRWIGDKVGVGDYEEWVKDVREMVQDANWSAREERTRAYLLQMNVLPREDDESDTEYEKRFTEFQIQQMKYMRYLTKGDFNRVAPQVYARAAVHAELVALCRTLKEQGQSQTIPLEIVDNESGEHRMADFDLTQYEDLKFGEPNAEGIDAGAVIAGYQIYQRQLALLQIHTMAEVSPDDPDLLHRQDNLMQKTLLLEIKHHIANAEMRIEAADLSGWEWTGGEAQTRNMVRRVVSNELRKLLRKESDRLRSLTEISGEEMEESVRRLSSSLLVDPVKLEEETSGYFNADPDEDTVNMLNIGWLAENLYLRPPKA